MKLIHTSDWHLGHTLYSFNREDEFRFFFAQLSEIVKKETPDALLISGDIFDTGSPTLSARRLWTEALLTLKSACPKMKIVAMAGNHDSGSNLDIPAPLYKDDFVIVGRKPATVKISDSTGLTGLICAVPFVSENCFRSRLPAHLALSDNPRKAYFENVLSEVEHERGENDIIILMAHEAVSNTDFSGQEKYNFNFVPLDNIGSGYNLLALGHIHCPQIVSVGPNYIASYSGAPIPMGFDENYIHSVSVVEINCNYKRPILRREEIKPLRPMLTLPEEGYLTQDEVFDSVNRLVKSGLKGYLRLNVLADHPLPSLNMRLRNELQNSDLRYCLLKYHSNENDGMVDNKHPGLSLQELKTVDPMTLAIDYFRRKTGTEMSHEMRSMLFDIIREEDDIQET